MGLRGGASRSKQGWGTMICGDRLCAESPGQLGLGAHGSPASLGEEPRTPQPGSKPLQDGKAPGFPPHVKQKEMGPTAWSQVSAGGLASPQQKSRAACHHQPACILERRQYEIWAQIRRNGMVGCVHGSQGMRKVAHVVARVYSKPFKENLVSSDF